MTNVITNGMGMNTLTKILLIIVIFLTGCTSGQDENMVKRESKVEALLTQNLLKEEYTITRGTNGVYVYTDRPHSTDISTIFATEQQTN